jgi:hypothetical protein
MKLSPKIGKLTAPNTEMLYSMMNNSLSSRIIILGHFFIKTRFSQKRQYPPLDEISECGKNLNYSKT